MPVGLNLLETVESKLLESGLLPRDASVLHRVIDFSKSEFSLRWNSAESGGRLVKIGLSQQLAQRKSDKPIICWKVEVEGGADSERSGRMLLASSQSSQTLGEEVSNACKSLLENSTNLDSEPVTEPTGSVPEEADSLLPDTAD